jgi:hypothetical protein
MIFGYHHTPEKGCDYFCGFFVLEWVVYIPQQAADFSGSVLVLLPPSFELILQKMINYTVPPSSGC